MLLLAALIVAAAAYGGARAIAREIAASRDAAGRGRALQILGVFAPALGAADADPRALLVWQPIARAARDLFPDEFAALDRAGGGTFPFSVERIQAAHSRWTAEWLAWERTHDAEYKLKAAEVEEELIASGGSAVVRGRLDSVEREKLDRYQRRYEEYVRVAKSLQALAGASGPGSQER
jgi:hypothetical protein